MLEIKHLSLRYNESAVLRDIHLTAQTGECILLTGASGSGKSSIIRTINGLATHYDGATIEGEVIIDQKAVTDMEIYELSTMIASVFQNPKTHFFNVDTTLELVFYLENRGVPRDEMQDRLEDMLSLFPIEHLMDRDIFKLSGGEKQILSIAAAYIAGTPIIVLDEPSSNLDDHYTNLLKEMLKVLKSRGITLIIAEHRLYYVTEIIDRVYVIDKGMVQDVYSREAFLALSQQTLEEKGLRPVHQPTLMASAPPTDEGGLAICHLERSFKERGRGICVENLHFHKGKVYGIVGHNGCGKSTFLRGLIGLEGKKDDNITLDGKPLRKRDRLRLSALVMQDVNHQLFTDSVVNEVGLGIDLIDSNRQEGVLHRLNLKSLADRHPMSLSGGEKQRVAIASVLLSEKGLIAFDEPTSGMDFGNMMAISKLIKEMTTDDNIILVISHDREFLNTTADYLVDISMYAFKHS